MTTWQIYQGSGSPHNGIVHLPEPPPWRRFDGVMPEQEPTPTLDPQTTRPLSALIRGQTFQASEEVIDCVNAALYLRRPLFVTGKPGTGKSSLAYAVAHELQLGSVLVWPITSRTTLQNGLYSYDAIGRFQEVIPGKDAPDIGRYIRLGPLGTAFLPSRRPRVLLIDEIDKSDIDLPNDLLHVFEEGGFDIPELTRLEQPHVEVFPYDSQHRVRIIHGRITCHAFPFVVITSNGERELSPPFLRRCLQLLMKEPDVKELTRIVHAHFAQLDSTRRQACEALVQQFITRRDQSEGNLATDQLLNAIYLIMQNVDLDQRGLREAVWRFLNTLEMP